MHTIKKHNSRKISKTQMLIVKGGTEKSKESAQAQTSHTRPLTGF